jgi:hypothetical protein
VPIVVALVPALGVTAAMAVYAFEPVRRDWAERREARGKAPPGPGRGTSAG